MPDAMPGDTTLLRDVIRWARAEGWKPEFRKGFQTPPVHWRFGVDPSDVIGVDYEPGANIPWFRVDVSIYQPGCRTHADYGVGSIREAVDVLVALGVLPARFSAAYAAGRASILDGAVEQWAVVYGDHSHYRVSGSTQALQLAATARSSGSGEAYAAHRLLPEWQRMEADRG